MNKETKGRILYEETCAMLDNIKCGRRVHYRKQINSSVSFEEEVQYAIIIGRFYYAFLLIVKELNNYQIKKSHQEIINHSEDYEVCEAFSFLFDLRKKADYEFKNLSLRKRWELFEKRHFPCLVRCYINKVHDLKERQ